MLDIGWDEMLFTAMIAIVVIGPKDLPRALRAAGNWIGKVRRVSGHFRAGVETMIREAEMEDMEKQWRAQNEAIMAAHPPSATADTELTGTDPGTLMEPLAAKPRPKIAAKAPAKAGTKAPAKARTKAKPK